MEEEDEITPMEMEVCHNYLMGMPKGRAYRAVFEDSGSIASAASSASRLFNRPRVKKYMDGLKEDLRKESVLTLQEKQAFLADVVRTPLGEITEESPLCQEITKTYDEDGLKSEKFKMPSKLGAIEIDNKMTGDNAPEKLELNKAPVINFSVGVSSGQIDNNLL